MTVVPPEFSVHHSGETPLYLTQIRIDSISVWYDAHLIGNKALIDYVTCNTGTLTHITGMQNKKRIHSMNLPFTCKSSHNIIMATWLRMIIFPVILQRSGSRATFLHLHRTAFTSPVLSSGFPAVLLPFPAVFYQNCTFLVYQPQVTLSSTIFIFRTKTVQPCGLILRKQKILYKNFTNSLMHAPCGEADANWG